MLLCTRAAVSAAILLAPFPAVAEDFRKLPGIEIKQLITGKVVSDDVHYSDRFKQDGAYEGVLMSEALRGRWKVDGDRLCVTLETAPPTCTELWQSGTNPPRYQRRQPELPSATDEVFIRNY